MGTQTIKRTLDYVSAIESESQNEKGTEFARFEDLARKLIRVPKVEIDKEREKDREKA